MGEYPDDEALSRYVAASAAVLGGTVTAKTTVVHGAFASEAERVCFEALRKGLRDVDVLMHGVRFHDHEHGDVEIDLLVLMPDAGFMVIEVKGGHVQYADGGWTTTNAEGSFPIHPTDQARRGLYSLKRYVERQPTWSRGRLRGDWMLAFPDTPVAVDRDMGPEARRETILARGELGDAAGRVYDLLMKPTDTPLPGAGWVEAVVGILQGAADEPATIQARVAQRIDHVDQLTAQQAAILTVLRSNQRLDITGSAGTGKTWLAIEQARRWAREGFRVAFITYTRGVSTMVGKALDGVPEDERPAFLGTFHRLGWQWGVRPNAEQARDPAFWESDGPRTMEKAAASLAAVDRFDAFIVDEAQDFADAWWPAILAAERLPGEARLAIFRDDAQEVFTGRRGRPELPMTSVMLDENLRNARQVVAAFQPLIDAPVTVKAGDGFATELVLTDAASVIGAADDAVAALVEERGWLPEHVALLTTKHRHPVHEERANEGKDSYWADLWSTDDVFYSTVAGFKGLERPVVVLAVDGFHEGLDPRNVLYTGMSRARDLLVVVGDEPRLSDVLGARHLRKLAGRR